MKRVGVLVSGRGSNLQALVAAAREGRLGGEVAVVVSNVAGAPALDKAQAAGVPAFVCDHRGKPREEHDRSMLGVLNDHGVELVCLAGRILEAEHHLYPRAVRVLLGGRWRLEGRRFVATAPPEEA